MFQLQASLPIQGLLIAGLLTAFAVPTKASQIDLRLDVEYAGAAAGAGGVWTLFAETDERGLGSLIVSLEGVNASVTSRLPVGRVNGSATNNAGFSNFGTLSLFGYRQITINQVVAAQGEQQGLFYGVGTLSNGSPNYPGKPSGTSSLGPNLTTLTGVQNSPWGNNDPFSSTGVSVLSGTFSAGSMPSFSDNGLLSGSLFTSIGTTSTPGNQTLDVEISTLVTSNLAFGVATGDYNADGRVDAADYTVWRDTFNQSVTPLTGADGNGDGQINGQDRSVWAANYGTNTTAATTAIPEPSLGVLAAIAASLAAARGDRGRFSCGKTVKTEQSGSIA